MGQCSARGRSTPDRLRRFSTVIPDPPGPLAPSASGPPETAGHDADRTRRAHDGEPGRKHGGSRFRVALPRQAKAARPPSGSRDRPFPPPRPRVRGRLAVGRRGGLPPPLARVTRRPDLPRLGERLLAFDAVGTGLDQACLVMGRWCAGVGRLLGTGLQATRLWCVFASV
jgi:hypothetical protein